MVAFLLPAQAVRFLMGFAGSPLAHYLELGIRLTVGGAFVLHSKHMMFSGAFALFGWVLLATTGALFLVPWQWHRRFAERLVPQAVRYLGLLGVASLAFGVLVLVACIRAV